MRHTSYCGRGAWSRQLWLSPRIGDHQSPHLSQPASMAPSTTSKAMRQVLVRQSDSKVARIGYSLERCVQYIRLLADLWRR
jgi:hypothetical protein